MTPWVWQNVACSLILVSEITHCPGLHTMEPHAWLQVTFPTRGIRPRDQAGIN